jgi:hypothetical protein
LEFKVFKTFEGGDFKNPAGSEKLAGFLVYNTFTK